MINLLPEEEKQAVLKRRKLKLILIFEAATLLFLVSLAFIFLSIRIYLAGEIDRAIKLSGIAVTKGARAAIEAAGGTIAD